MGEIGKVIGFEEEMAIVKMKKTEACAKCRACTAGFSSEEMHIKAINLCDAKLDDYVRLDLENANFLKAVMIMYFIPFLALIVGIFIGYYSLSLLHLKSYEEVGSFFIGFILMVGSYLIIKKNQDRFNTKEYVPYISTIVNKNKDL